MKKEFELEKYNPNWKILFLKEKKELQKIFKTNLASIHHIGSTAIPAAIAKPEIDILLIVKTDSNLSIYDEQLTKLGYQIRGECLEFGGTPGRYYYSKDNRNIRTHKLHVCQIGHKEILPKLVFVEYLNEHKEKAEEYSRLKLDLTKKYNYGRNFEKYLTGKTSFILDIVEKGLKKYSSKKIEGFT